MVIKTFAILTLAAGIGIRILAGGDEPEGIPPMIDPKDFKEVHALIRPQPGEHVWNELPWETNVHAARKRAVKENKPLIIWFANNGSPLGSS